MKRHAQCPLAPDPAHVADVRRFTTQHLAEWGLDEVADTAVLLVSETVTNIILHAGTAGTLSLEVEGGVLRVEVRDGNATLPARRRYADDAATGRGLLLVDALADRWGAEPEGTGKVVWFEVALPGAVADTVAEGSSEAPGLDLAAEAVDPVPVYPAMEADASDVSPHPPNRPRLRGRRCPRRVSAR